MNNLSFIKVIPNESQMLEFGSSLALACNGATVIFLQGNLGAGKTTLARGFLRGFGYAGKVKSPTYTIVEPYDIEGQKLYHFDFYRLNDPEELEFIGIQDYFSEGAISLIEWPDKGSLLLPPADLSCYIEPHEEGREIRIEAHTAQGKTILKRLVRIEAE
ncbi:MAG: tRNA (adenosine(37)-N6)-threonylcarbamoyltransferase complex ATPase subunit type 1 TsaE [Gammaproteobacteria bacterium]|nr:tRNA (adenosine(37)-N6)-threonylcarbamoyltransferase complex ATPase subunit type 1 TsaE [Gammaproteobacteria bacterium]